MPLHARARQHKLSNRVAASVTLGTPWSESRSRQSTSPGLRGRTPPCLHSRGRALPSYVRACPYRVALLGGLVAHLASTTPYAKLRVPGAAAPASSHQLIVHAVFGLLSQELSRPCCTDGLLLSLPSARAGPGDPGAP